MQQPLNNPNSYFPEPCDIFSITDDDLVIAKRAMLVLDSFGIKEDLFNRYFNDPDAILWFDIDYGRIDGLTGLKDLKFEKVSG